MATRGSRVDRFALAALGVALWTCSAGAAAQVTDPVAARPRWMAGQQRFEWRQIPGTAPATLGTGPFAGTAGRISGHLAYSGAALRSEGSWLLVFGGGHADYSGNDVLGISLREDRPVWRVLRGPTLPPDPRLWNIAPNAPGKGVWWDTHHLPDGRPASRHSGWALQFIDRDDRLMSFYDAVAYGTSNTTTGHVDGFRFGERDWDPALRWPSLPQRFQTTYPWTVKDPRTEDVYVATGHAIHRWNRSDGSFTPIGRRYAWGIDQAIAGVDVARDRLLVIGVWSDPARITAHVVRLADGVATPVTLGGPHAADLSGPRRLAVSGFDWCPTLARFVLLPDDGHSYTVDPATLEVERLAVTGRPPPRNSRYAHDYGSGIYGRFRYVPELGGFVYLASWTEDLWFLKTAR